MFGIRFRLVLDIPFYVPFFLRDGKPDPEGKTKHEGGDEEAVMCKLSWIEFRLSSSGDFSTRRPRRDDQEVASILLALGALQQIPTTSTNALLGAKITRMALDALQRKRTGPSIRTDGEGRVSPGSNVIWVYGSSRAFDLASAR
jgi:hypothetical protein